VGKGVKIVSVQLLQTKPSGQTYLQLSGADYPANSQCSEDVRKQWIYTLKSSSKVVKTRGGIT
jgi:hypothetical protein